MHAFWAMYSPLALCSMYPCIIPFSLPHSLRAKKLRPSFFHKYLPPSHVASTSGIQMQKRWCFLPQLSIFLTVLVNKRGNKSKHPPGPASHIGRVVCLRLPPTPLLLHHDVPPSPCHLLGALPQMANPGCQASCLSPHKQSRKIAPVLAKHNTPLPVRDRFSWLSGEK